MKLIQQQTQVMLDPTQLLIEGSIAGVIGPNADPLGIMAIAAQAANIARAQSGKANILFCEQASGCENEQTVRAIFAGLTEVYEFPRLKKKTIERFDMESKEINEASGFRLTVSFISEDTPQTGD